MKHFIDLADLSHSELISLLDLADTLKSDFKQHKAVPLLAGKTLGMIFAKSSTRTRVSFEVGMYQLGGHALFLSTQDIQIGRGETISDTAAVLSRMLDGIMIRTFAHQDVLDLARFGSIPVINGLTDLMHPCQALADLQTIRENFGRLDGLKMAYLGDGNNMAHSLAQAGALAGMHVSIATPPGYSCSTQLITAAAEVAQSQGGSVTTGTDAAAAASQADVIYTDTWISMGQEAEKEQRKTIFTPYQVNQDMMEIASPDAIFLHCLPAYRGLEVTAGVIDGPASRIFDQAENRLHAQKAILATVMGSA